MRSIREIRSMRQHGMTLVELMVAMTIGLVLTVGLGQVYLGTRNVYRVNENAARLQENGRFAIDELSRDIRMAGFAGCSNKTKINNIVLSQAAWVTFGTPLLAYDTVPTSPFIGIPSAQVYPNTDVIRIQRAASTGARLDGNLDPNNANIKIQNNLAQFKTGEIIVVSDCVNTDVFQATSVSNSNGNAPTTITHASSGNTVNKLSKVYQDQTDVMRFVNNLYYIGSGADPFCPQRSLCRKSLSGNVLDTASVLANDVENMQIKVGEDLNIDGDNAANRADRYVDPGTASINWDNVVSVKLELLLSSSDDNVATSAQTPMYNGAPVSGVTDKKLRRVFASTVALRNRVP